MASLPFSRMAVGKRWREGKEGEFQEGEGGVRKGEGEGREVVEHCSADKLMQQSRLSQQHTPSSVQ